MTLAVGLMSCVVLQPVKQRAVIKKTAALALAMRLEDVENNDMSIS